MAKITKEIQVLKEVSEVGDFAVELIRCVKNKGDYLALMPKLVAAVEGVGSIGEEIRDTGALITTVLDIGNGIAQVFIEDANKAQPEGD